jgi:uncharacterized membrane protein YgcG
VSTSAILSIKILADATAANKGMAATETRVGRLSSKVSKLALPAAVAGAALVGFGKVAVDAASATQQAYGAVDTVFGRSAGKVKAWSDQAATSVGLSKSAYATLASTLGASLKNMGIPLDKLAGQSDSLIKLGADLSATYGGTTAEAVDALSSALRGETDPIERYGISIKQSTIAAAMAAKGTDKLTGAAATAAHTQALLALVTKQSGKAQGQFARESGSAAGAAQIAAAKAENLKSSLGTALLPVVSAVTAALGRFGDFAAKHTRTVQLLAAAAAVLVVGILALSAALKVYAIYQEAVTVATKIYEAAQRAAWVSSPIGLVVLAIIAVVVAVVILWKKCEAFRDVVLAVWAAIKVAIDKVVAVFKKVWAVAFAIVKVYFTVYKAVVLAIFAAIKVYIKIVVDVFMTLWKGAVLLVRGYILVFKTVFKTVMDNLITPIVNVVNKIRDGLGGAITWLRDKVQAVKDKLSGPFQFLHDLIGKIVGAVQTLIGWIRKIHIPDIPDWLKNWGMGPGWSTDQTGDFSGGGGSRPGGGGTFSGSGTVAPQTVVHVNGALDPEAVARQIRLILRAHDQRIGA